MRYRFRDGPAALGGWSRRRDTGGEGGLDGSDGVDRFDDEAPGSAAAPPALSVGAGLASLRQRFGALTDATPGIGDDRPVFVLGAGWRTGSTLLQRLLVSDPSLLMWGEPYDHSAPIRRLAEMVVPFDDRWPPHRSIVNDAADMAADRWIANRYPHPLDFLGAHRCFLDRLFAEPARRLGFERWGIKTVRLGGEHATYLRALYPGARIVFLVRNPYDSFLSYRLLHDVRKESYWWYYRWPDLQVSSAAQFGLVWRQLVSSFCEVAHDLDALLLSFESLATGDGVDELARFVGAEVQMQVLADRVGASTEQRRKPTEDQANLTIEEIWQLRDNVDPLARDLGYTGPTARQRR